ncbi:MAG: hypothetical protein ACWA41_05090 [Putridiphycobacter sp.]
MKKITYIFILTVLLTACKKQHTVTIQAQNLTNLLDGSHYAGMNYVVLERGYFFNHKSNGIATGQLDANGRAVIDVKLKKNLDYVLGIQKPDDVCYTKVEIEYPIIFKEENNISFNYAPCGYLKFILNNVNCNSLDDSITYVRTWVTGDNEGEGFHPRTYVGCEYYSSDYFIRPIGEYRYDWEVFKNGVSNSFSQNFVLNEGDSVIFQIDY